MEHKLFGRAGRSGNRAAVVHRLVAEGEYFAETYCGKTLSGYYSVHGPATCPKCQKRESAK
jgi:hypothetical protein